MESSHYLGIYRRSTDHLRPLITLDLHASTGPHFPVNMHNADFWKEIPNERFERIVDHTYGMLNLIAGLCDLIHNPSWRPTFRCPWQVSMAGACLSGFLMLMIDPVWTICSISAVGLVYLYLKRRSIEGSFQDLRKSIVFFFSRLAIYWLSKTQDDSSNWVPQVIVFSKAILRQKKIARLASSITRRSGLLSIVSIVPETWSSPEQLDRAKLHLQTWVDELSIKSLTDAKAFPGYYEGIVHLVKSYGIGPLDPNTMMLPIIGENMAQEVEGLVTVAAAAHQHNKNFVLFFDPPRSPLSLFTRPHYRKKIIDLWWCHEQRDSFELMLSFIMSMRTSLVWKHREVNLRAVVADTNAQAHLKDHFVSLLKNMRVKAKARVDAESSVLDQSHLQKHSHKADLVFVPLRSIASFESHTAYSEYLLKFATEIPPHVPTVAVTCYDSIDHKEVYQS